MPIPKYDEMYRAFLDCLADGQLAQIERGKRYGCRCFLGVRKGAG